MRARAGFTLLEVIVAMTLLSVGVLGLAGAAGAARASLARSAAVERAVLLVTAAADSLLHAPAAGDGVAVAHGIEVQWRVFDAAGVRDVVLTAQLPQGATLVFGARGP